MSGIISSVGARSGVIGSTEIPGGYEEGTWTPVIKTGQPSFGTTVTLTGGTQIFQYTKVGNICTINFSISVSTASAPSGDEIKIEGFPFTCKTGTQFSPGTPILIHSSGLDISADSVVAIIPGQSYALVMSHAGAGYGFTNASSSGASYISFGLTYLTA